MLDPFLPSSASLALFQISLNMHHISVTVGDSFAFDIALAVSIAVGLAAIGKLQFYAEKAPDFNPGMRGASLYD